MLVHDPRADRSAAALSVGAGSLDDPPGKNGLAHFLEHMLFLGTEKYPKADGYQKHLSSHAGFGNAYTANDHVNYYFEVAPSGYEEALDRFAQFFIAPLFNKEFASREVNAVNSEHAKNRESDSWRTHQIQRSLYEPTHPSNHFSTGNLKTLAGVGTAELKTFYAKNYSAERMALSLVSSLSLSQQEKMARKMFSAVKKRSLPPKNYPVTYLKKKQAFRLITIEPVSDKRVLSMEFPLPSMEKHYTSKPLGMIASVLGHEGKGSLLSLLKIKNLATGLSAGGGQSTNAYASLVVTVSLTPEGLKQYQQIVALTLGAVKGLRERGIPPYLFEENQMMGQLAFRYRQQGKSASEARSLTSLMQSIPLKDLPRAPYLFSEYTPSLYKQTLGHLTPDNMMVTLMAKGVFTDKIEKYYGAKYGYREFSGAIYQKLVSAKTHPAWYIPKPNPFIPKNTELLMPDGPLKLVETTFRQLQKDGVKPETLSKLKPLKDVSFTSTKALIEGLEKTLKTPEQQKVLPLVFQNALALPTQIIKAPSVDIWHLPDYRFRQPKAQIILKFSTLLAHRNPRQAMLGALYEEALSESLNEFSYPISQAGLHYAVSTPPGGVTLSFGGYSPRMLELMETIAARLKKVDISKKVFASIKERAKRGLENARFSEPYHQARYYNRLFLKHPYFSREAYLEELKTITLPEVKAFAVKLYQKRHVQGVTVGNLSPDALRKSISRVLETLGGDPLPKAERVEEQVRLLPKKANYEFSHRLAVDNSLGGIYFQVGQATPKLKTALSLISRPFGEATYTNLRTRQQLGYIVWGGMMQIEKTLGMYMLVQSGTYPADTLLDKMNKFVPEFIKGFSQIPDEVFEKYRAAVVVSKLKRPASLSEVASSLYWVLFKHKRNFDYVSEEILAAEALKRFEVEEILHQFLLGKGKRKLTLRLTGKNHKAGKPKGTPIKPPKSTGLQQKKSA